MKRVKRKGLALLLALAMLVGMLPSVALPAAAAGSITVGPGQSLNEAYATLGDTGGTIVLAGDPILTAPLTISANVEFTGGGTITPIGTAWTADVTPEGSNKYNTMLQITSGTVTIGPGITIDAKERCRAISVDGAGSKLVLNGCTIQRGRLDKSQQGAGVYLGSGAKLEAGGGARFIKNTCEANSATGGGALYVFDGAEASLDAVTFTGNEANSGGAIYTYLGTVRATANTVITDNKASQRGGAIHDHGLVILNGTTLNGNTSGQLGGAIYVSASAQNAGQLVAHNATITGNFSGNSGGGVVIADMAQAFLGGTTS